MFRWQQDSQVCYVFRPDVNLTWGESKEDIIRTRRDYRSTLERIAGPELYDEMQRSVWFTRG